eukprot:479119-Hanusia_phi.AAC.1
MHEPQQGHTPARPVAASCSAPRQLRRGSIKERRRDEQREMGWESEREEREGEEEEASDGGEERRREQQREEEGDPSNLIIKLGVLVC